MDANKELQKANDSMKKQNLSLTSLKNEGLGRTLTDQEISAVKWHVEKVLSIGPTEKPGYNNAVRSIIEIGNIENILKNFQRSYERGFTVAHRRMKSGIIETHIVLLDGGRGRKK